MKVDGPRPEKSSLGFGESGGVVCLVDSEVFLRTVMRSSKLK